MKKKISMVLLGIASLFGWASRVFSSVETRLNNISNKLAAGVDTEKLSGLWDKKVSKAAVVSRTFQAELNPEDIAWVEKTEEERKELGNSFKRVE